MAVSKDRYMKFSMRKCIRIRNCTHLKCAVGLNMDTFGRNDISRAQQPETVNNTYSNIWAILERQTDRCVAAGIPHNTYPRTTYCVSSIINKSKIIRQEAVATSKCRQTNLM